MHEDREAGDGPSTEQAAGGTKKSLFKTEMCRGFRESGECRYGNKCQFAHGKSELRPVSRPRKYKTEPCKNFEKDGVCSYGPRCRFLHNEISSQYVSQSTRKFSPGRLLSEEFEFGEPYPSSFFSFNFGQSASDANSVISSDLKDPRQDEGQQDMILENIKRLNVNTAVASPIVSPQSTASTIAPHMKSYSLNSNTPRRLNVFNSFDYL